MKKIRYPAVLAALALMLSLAAPALAADLPALGRSAVFTIGSKTVTVDGQVYTMDVAPYIDAAGRTMLPARYVGDVLGCTVSWEPMISAVILSQHDSDALVELTVGSDQLAAAAGGTETQVTMDTAAVTVPPGRVMIPVRFVAQALGYKTLWNPAGMTVTLTPVTVSPGPVQPSAPSAAAVTGASLSLSGTPVPAVVTGTQSTITLQGGTDEVVGDPTLSVSQPCILTLSSPEDLAGEEQQLKAGENTLNSLNNLLALLGHGTTLGDLSLYTEADTGSDAFIVDGSLANSAGTTNISLNVVINVDTGSARVQVLNVPTIQP